MDLDLDAGLEVLVAEVRRLRDENAVMARLITDHLGAYAKGDDIVFVTGGGYYDGQTHDPEGAAHIARLKATDG